MTAVGAPVRLSVCLSHYPSHHNSLRIIHQKSDIRAMGLYILRYSKWWPQAYMHNPVKPKKTFLQTYNDFETFHKKTFAR